MTVLCKDESLSCANVQLNYVEFAVDTISIEILNESTTEKA